MQRTNHIGSAQSLALPTPLVGFGALLVLSLSLRCASKSSDDSDASRRGGMGPAGAGAGGAGSGGAGRSNTSGAGGAGIVNPNGEIGGVPGTCSAETVTRDCPPPASTCTGDGQRLDFINPTCAAGQCQWTGQSYPCVGPCSNGVCLPPDNVTGTCTSSAAGAAGQASDSVYPPADCSIPPSTCADSHTLNYYYVECVQGQCLTTVELLRCATGCTDGACQGNFTAK
jgi:hypothetical protein